MDATVSQMYLQIKLFIVERYRNFNSAIPFNSRNICFVPSDTMALSGISVFPVCIVTTILLRLKYLDSQSVSFVPIASAPCDIHSLSFQTIYFSLDFLLHSNHNFTIAYPTWFFFHTDSLDKMYPWQVTMIDIEKSRSFLLSSQKKEGRKCLHDILAIF